MKTKLDALVEVLRQYDRVCVTGPARSGTQIATKILSVELGYSFQREAIFSYDQAEECFAYLRQNKKLCLQGIAFTRWMQPVLGLFDGDEYSLAVVFMMRRAEDILASQNRVRWTEHGEDAEADRFGGRPSCVAMQRWWIDNHMGNPRCYTLHYGDLEHHPLWVDKEHRKGWPFDQIKPSK